MTYKMLRTSFLVSKIMQIRNWAFVTISRQLVVIVWDAKVVVIPRWSEIGRINFLFYSSSLVQFIIHVAYILNYISYYVMLATHGKKTLFLWLETNLESFILFFLLVQSVMYTKDTSRSEIRRIAFICELYIL